jgi:hypothetical protein
MTAARDRKIDREIEASVRLEARQPLRERPQRERTVPVDLYPAPPPYPSRPPRTTHLTRRMHDELAWRRTALLFHWP